MEIGKCLLFIGKEAIICSRLKLIMSPLKPIIVEEQDEKNSTTWGYCWAGLWSRNPPSHILGLAHCQFGSSQNLCWMLVWDDQLEFQTRENHNLGSSDHHMTSPFGFPDLSQGKRTRITEQGPRA